MILLVLQTDQYFVLVNLYLISICFHKSQYFSETFVVSQALKKLKNMQTMQKMGIYCTKFLLLKIRLVSDLAQQLGNQSDFRKQQFLAKYLVKISHAKATNMHSRGRVFLAVFLSLNSKEWRRIYWKIYQPFSCCYQRYCWFIFPGNNEIHSNIKGKHRMQTVML